MCGWCMHGMVCVVGVSVVFILRAGICNVFLYAYAYVCGCMYVYIYVCMFVYIYDMYEYVCVVNALQPQHGCLWDQGDAYHGKGVSKAIANINNIIAPKGVRS